MKTLQDILNKKKEQEERNNRPKLNWFTLKAGESKRVQFLQELGDEAPNYTKEKGSALFLVEHVSPYDFRKKAECSMDREGRCFACEMNLEEKTVVVDGEEKSWPWAQKINMYIQLIDEDGEVQVLSRPALGAVFDALHQFASEENDGNITGQTFKAAKGKNKSDPWTFTTTKQAIDVPDAVEIVDLEKVIGYKLPYEEQRNFYLPADAKPASVEKEKKVSHTESEW